MTTKAERAVLKAAEQWWIAKRPLGWMEEQHDAAPWVNLTTRSENTLARCVTKYREERSRAKK